MKIRWGNCNTQNYRVAQFLNTGAHLSPLSAQNNLDGVQRLAARVEEINFELRPQGYAQIKNLKKRTANGKRYSEYYGYVPFSVLALL